MIGKQAECGQLRKFETTSKFCLERTTSVLHAGLPPVSRWQLARRRGSLLSVAGEATSYWLRVERPEYRSRIRTRRSLRHTLNLSGNTRSMDGHQAERRCYQRNLASEG